MTIAFYISESKDLDLCGFLNSVGASKFRDIAKLCVLGLFNKDAASEAVYLAKTSPPPKKQPKFNNGFARIRIVLNGEDGGQSENILNTVKDKYKSVFVKTVIRQVLGPQILLKFFLKEDAESFFAESVYVPVRTINVVNVSTNMPVVNQTEGSLKPKMQDSGFDIDEKLTTDSFSVSSYQAESSASSIPLPTRESLESECVSDDSTDDDEFDILDMLEAML